MFNLRQSTASQSVLIGPFVDSTDGNTAETALTIANTDIRLSKNGANIAAKTSGGGTHDELGYYTITLDATDTNTVGRLQLMVHVAGALPVYHEFQVLEENVYDAIYATSAALGTDVAAILVDTGTTLDGKIDTIDTNVDSILLDTAEIGAAGAGLTAINLPDQTMNITGNITGNLSGSVGSVTGAVGSVIGSVGSVTGAINTAAGTITTLDGLDTAQDTQHSTTQSAITALNDIAATDVWAAATRTLTANTNFNDPTAAAIADAVWDEVQTGHVIAGTFGKYLDTEVSGVGGGSLTAADVADAVWDEARGDHTTASSFGERVNANITYVNGTQVGGTGASGDEWGPA